MKTAFAALIILCLSAYPASPGVRDGFGLSTQILVDEKELTILHVVVRSIECGSPAYHAGVHAGDRIVSMNGILVENIALGDYVNNVGRAIEKGSKVVSLLLMRGTTRQEPKTVKLIEGPIVEDDVCRNSVRV